MATDTKTLKTSKIACWLALACLVVPMFGSYFFDDMFSTVSQIFKNPEMLQLGWNSQQFGFYAGGYSFLCVWGGLIICGILLDKFGVRLIGSVFVGMMVVGAAIVTCAISSKGLTPNSSLTIAYIGCMLFGLGSEIAGVAVTRSIAKWFKGKNVALAMGLQLAIARIGTGLAMLLSPVLVLKNHVEGTMFTLSETNKPAIVGLSLLFIGMILWAIFVAMDAKYDRQEGIVSQRGEVKEEDKFKFSDIFKVLGNPRFIMIALLCVFFYCCVISFKKFGTSIIIPRFGLDASTASVMISMIAFAPVIFTPLFGALVDKVGKATTWMILGAVLVFCAHLIIGFAPGVHFYGYAAIVLLGIGYSLVPSAMWPTVPKIIPEKNLGTAYSMIYWIQNMGMLLVPIFVGRIMKNYADKKEGLDASTAEILDKAAAVHSEFIFVSLGIVAITVAVCLFFNSKKHPELKIDRPSKEVA
ncbi:MAG: MFS transporter [Bacteroidales bacterium]|nr:MFS transporter [Bacteroidales bacterium]MBQ1754061.1 MFS transporter [Bacteroidales bacterium]MBQ4221300.1 MFS transporter [Bacteroidales bacterium]MBQ5434940.1 MFS transporter [Bacteroidales bacterium]